MDVSVSAAEPCSTLALSSDICIRVALLCNPLASTRHVIELDGQEKILGPCMHIAISLRICESPIRDRSDNTRIYVANGLNFWHYGTNAPIA